MSEGGTFRDSWDGASKGVIRFAKKVWFWGHNDQRASWLMHLLVSVAIAWAFKYVGWVSTWLSDHPWYAYGATAAMLFYGWRELGDARYHRRVGDWNKIDKDTNWQGKEKRGVSAAYDGWADWLGPLAHCVGAWGGTA